MKRASRFQTIILVIIAVLIGYYFGVNKVAFDWKNFHPTVSFASKEPPPGVTNVDFSTFWTVWQKVESEYYDKTKLDSQKMLNGAISGMVASLDDPFTIYLPPVQNNNFKQGLAGQFQGIGAELGVKDQKIIVIAPLNGSPAQKAGVRAGDQILAVDGASTATWTLSNAVEKIRGEKGTTVTLTIVHKDESSSKDVKITRDVITVKSVNVWLKKIKDIDAIKVDSSLGDEKVAYVSLSQFGDNSNTEWLSSLNQLSMDIQKAGDVKGIILDLRNNPGGYLTDAQFIASEFLSKGTAVVRESPAQCSAADSGQTQDGQDCVLQVNRQGLFTDSKTKVIILVNRGSASASEIVTGALRDNGRAEVVGEKSFGKGTIQQAEDLGQGAGIHITIAKWLTPKGTWVHGVGITPDVSVALDSKEPERDLQLEKAVLELTK